MSNQPLKTENSKRIFHISKDIFLYIIGANLALAFLVGIMPEFFDFKESIITDVFLALASLAVICWWVIKWGVESTLRKNKVYPKECFKISIIIGVIPIFLVLIYVLVRIPSASRYAEIIAPIPFLYVLFFVLKELIIGFIGGLVYGTATYFWLRKLVK